MLDMKKIVRTICLFSDTITDQVIEKLEKISQLLTHKNFNIQTKRVCSPSIEEITKLDSKYAGDDYIFSVGSIPEEKLNKNLESLLACKDTSFNLDLTEKQITEKDAEILFEIINNKASKTFNFAYVFNNPSSSPFFPSGSYSQNGFSVGLQPTDLSDRCQSVEEWLEKMRVVWQEIDLLVKPLDGYLGIDSSIAPLFKGSSSLVNFIKRLGFDFSYSTTTDIYTVISKFIKENNPNPTGLCGLMFPCLEDFELAEEYEKGNFSIERNIFLSLHSGLGIDTYPVAVNQNKERIVEILKLLQNLSNKYKKPLSARFASDGKAKIGEKTDFKNQYLKDVTVREL